MPITAFVGLLDDILDDPPSDPLFNSEVDAFLDSGAVHKNIQKTARAVLSRLKTGGIPFSDTEEDNPGVLFKSIDEFGVNRQIVIKSGQGKLGFYSTFPERYAIIAMSDIVVNRFRITGEIDGDIYSRPNAGLTLLPMGQVSMSKGHVFVRSDPLDVFDVHIDHNTRYLNFIRGMGDSTYQLVFDKESLACVATSMTDVSSTKAIGFLDILETIGSDQIALVSHEFTNHYSPIVRWRALSSMNKISHPRTTDVLERFTHDPVAFVRDGAKSVLAKGRR